MYKLGIDIGSTTIKMALVEVQGDDIQNLISRSVSKEDIAASMLHAVSMQVVSALARGTEVHPKIFLCGGPFAYIPAYRSFCRLWK